MTIVRAQIEGISFVRSHDGPTERKEMFLPYFFLFCSNNSMYVVVYIVK